MKMNLFRRIAIELAFLEKVCFPIQMRKGASGNEDPNAGFENRAFDKNFDPNNSEARYGDLNKYAVWWIDFSKHLERIRCWIATGQIPGDGLLETCADAINYLLILVSMLVQDEFASFMDKFLFSPSDDNCQYILSKHCIKVPGDQNESEIVSASISETDSVEQD